MKIKLILFIAIIILETFFCISLWQRIDMKRGIVIDKNIFDINPYTISNTYKYFYEPYLTEEQHDWLPYVAKYHINKDKLNDRFDYSVDKKNDIFRIITLGDSLTFGENVNTEDNWTELLEDSLNSNNTLNCSQKIEVINLGMYGYGTEYEVERFKRRGKKYSPDLVVWTFTDFGRFNEEIETVAHKIAEDPKKATKNVNIYKFLFREDILKRRTESSELYWNIARKYIGAKYSYEDIVNKENYLLDQFNVVYKGRILYTSFSDVDISFTEKIITPRVDNLQFHYFKFSFGFNDNQYLLPDSHPNKLGHKKMMEDIIHFLLNNKTIICK